MLPMAIYTITFEQISLGYGSAVTVLLFAIIVAASLLILVMRVRRRPAFVPTVEEEDDRGGRVRTHIAPAQHAVNPALQPPASGRRSRRSGEGSSGCPRR